MLREGKSINLVLSLIITNKMFSNLQDVDGCICINPGHLSDHASGEGTFARVVVYPPEAETAAPFNYVVCQVVKS